MYNVKMYIDLLTRDVWFYRIYFITYLTILRYILWIKVGVLNCFYDWYMAAIAISSCSQYYRSQHIG